MRRSHVEMRSRRYAAVQYVSETHHHKPEVTNGHARLAARRETHRRPQESRRRAAADRRQVDDRRATNAGSTNSR